MKRIYVILIILTIILTASCDSDNNNNNNSSTAIQDTDGDGVDDQTELTDNTDFQNSCEYNISNQNIEIVSDSWKSLDCDGDGVNNQTELADNTDLQNSCEYNISNQNIEIISDLWKSLDCDGDNFDNGTELVNGTNPLVFDEPIQTYISLTGQSAVIRKGFDIGDGTPPNLEDENYLFRIIVDCGIVFDQFYMKTSRGILQFENELQTGVVIDSIKLKVIPQAYNSGNSPNQLEILKITEPWDENTIKWSDLIETTSDNKISLDLNNNIENSLLNLNVTELIGNLNNFNGFMFKFKDDSNGEFDDFRFYSFDYSNTELRPTLTFYYH